MKLLLRIIVSTVIVAGLVCILLAGQARAEDIEGSVYLDNDYSLNLFPTYWCPVHGDIEQDVIDITFEGLEGVYCMRCIAEWFKNNFDQVEKIK